MLNYIRGRLVEKCPNYVILDCAGLGILVHISSFTFNSLPEPMEEVQLLTELWIKENGVEIYGFRNEHEREAFRVMTTVPGIGPKLAMTVLSTLSPAQLVSAVGLGDIRTFERVAGLGRKRAERLVLELKGKLDTIPACEEAMNLSLMEDAIFAMVSLGYKRNEAKRVIEQILLEKPNLNLEQILKEAFLLISNAKIRR